MNYIFRFPLLFAAASFSWVSAQSVNPVPTETRAVELEHVVVSAHPYGRSANEIAQPTHLLTGDHLDQHQATSLGELLSSEPGVSSSYFGPGASRPIIRALGGPRVVVLENGTDTIDASVVSPDHAVSLDPLLIERVEITRGPAALLQGGAAIGGAVNVITHRIHQNLPQAGVHGRAETRIGTGNDERSGGIVVEGSSNSIAWHVDAFRRETDDVEIPGSAESAALRALEAEEADDHEEDSILGVIPNTALKSDGGAAGFSWIGNQGYLGVSVSRFDTLYGVPPGAHAHEHAEEAGPDEAEDAPDYVSIDLSQRRLNLEGEWRNPAGGWQAFRFKAADFSAIGDEAFLPPTTTDESALFIFEELKQGADIWQFGARSEWQRITTTDNSGRRNSGQSLSASLGWVRALGDHWSLAASLAHAERLPNAQELYADGPHVGTNAYEIGDASLGHETSHGIDLTLRRDVGLVSGSATVFVNRFDGYIYENPTGAEEDGLPVYAFTQRDAQLHGAELETVFHLWANEAGHVDFTVAGDFVRARNTTDRTNLPRTTPARLRLGLDWEHNAWRVGTELSHALKQDRLAPGEILTASYSLWSAYVGYRWITSTVTWDVLVRGTNLTDQEARLHTSFLKDVAPLPGRNVALSLRASF